MERFQLQLEAREEGKKPNQLRRSGKIPVTVYGAEAESKSMQVCQKSFEKLPNEAFSHLVNLETPEGTINALIKHVQRKAVSSEILHVEFYRVAKEKKLKVTVPLKFTGTCPAVQKGGQLVEMFHDTHLECLPGDIPDYLEVDLSKIENIDDGIHFSELKIPQGTKILNPLEELVARVVAKKSGK